MFRFPKLKSIFARFQDFKNSAGDAGCSAGNASSNSSARGPSCSEFNSSVHAVGNVNEVTDCSDHNSSAGEVGVQISKAHQGM